MLSRRRGSEKDGGRDRGGWALVLWLMAGVTACGRPPEHPGIDPNQVLRQATTQEFGESTDPQAVVARVEDQPITVGQLALCRQQAPAWPVQRCLDELVEVAAVNRHATSDDRADPRLDEARSAGLASALVRREIDLPMADDAVSDADVQAFLQDPSNRLYFARPELRIASHLLVNGPNGPSPEAHDLAERIAAQAAWPVPATDADLSRVRTQWAPEARRLGLGLRVEHGILVQPDNQPEAAWPGVALVAQPFADALFALDRPGAVSAPVDSEFGTHIILYERDYPAEALDPTQAQALARHELAQRRRTQALNGLRTALLDHTEVVRHDAVQLFGLSDEQLIRERSSSLREQFGPQSNP